jgi:hypothetical protein
LVTAAGNAIPARRVLYDLREVNVFSRSEHPLGAELPADFELSMFGVDLRNSNRQAVPYLDMHPRIVSALKDKDFDEEDSSSDSEGDEHC